MKTNEQTELSNIKLVALAVVDAMHQIVAQCTAITGQVIIITSLWARAITQASAILVGGAEVAADVVG